MSRSLLFLYRCFLDLACPLSYGLLCQANNKGVYQAVQKPAFTGLLESVVGAESNATGMAFTIATPGLRGRQLSRGGSHGMANRILAAEDAGRRGSGGKTVSKIRVENGVATGVIIDGEPIPAMR